MTAEVWTPEMLERLRVLEAMKPAISYQTIACIIRNEFKVDVTKNACIGKAHRSGLPQRPRIAVPKENVPRKMPKPSREKPPEPLPPPRAGSCKWPLEASAACGAPTRGGCPYCPAHAKTAYLNPRPEWM